MNISALQASLFSSSPLLSDTTNSADGSDDSSSVADLIGNSSNNSSSKLQLPGSKLLASAQAASSIIEALRQDGVPITPDGIGKALDDMRDEFRLKVQTGLLAIGVNENAEFKLAVDGSGKVIVNSDSPDKAKIQNFFDNHPEFAKAVSDLQALSNFKDAIATKGQQSMSGADMKRSLQLESIDALLGNTDTSDMNSLILSYSKNKLSAQAGVNRRV